MSPNDKLIAKAHRLGIPDILIAAAVLDGVLDALVQTTLDAGEDDHAAEENEAARRAERKFGSARWEEMDAETRADLIDEELDRVREELDELYD